MDGRLQNEIKIEKAIIKKLKTMPEYVYDWYINLKASRKTILTCKDYIGKVYCFLAYINKNVMSVTIDDITERNVSNYFLSIQTKNEKGYMVYTSDSYQGTVWSCLNSFLGYLYKRGDIKRNYIELIQKPKNHDIDKINKNRQLLTQNDFKKICNIINVEKNITRRNRDKAIMLLFMSTGIRRSALCNIMVDDVDFDNCQLLVVDKGNKMHEYTLNDVVINALTDWIFVRHNYIKDINDDHLFISQKGSPINPNTVYDLVQKYTQKAIGKPLSPHKLRAGYCSILYNKTHDAEFVRRAVGHANVATTQRYIVTKGDEKKKASEIMASIF